MKTSPRLKMPNLAKWSYHSLDELCSVVSRGSAPTYVDCSSVLAIGQRCVATSGFDASLARPHAEQRMEGTLSPEDGDVLLNSTGTGTIGRSGVFSGSARFIIDGHVTLLRPLRARANGKWLDALFKTWWGQNLLETQCYAGSTNQVELSRTRLAMSELPTPPVAEQLDIVEILDTLDEAIRKTEQIVAKLKHVKLGLLQDLLMRGIDDNGELRDPLLHPKQFKNSEMGPVPKGWQFVKAGAVCSLITKGTTPDSHSMWEGTDGIRFLRVDNLSFDGALDLEASSFRISERTHQKFLARSRCIAGDVLMNIVGPPLGKLGLVSSDLGQVNINQAIAVFRAKPEMLPEFLLLWLQHRPTQTWFVRNAKQTSGQMNLTLAMCQAVPVPKLSVTEQRETISRVDALSSRLTRETTLCRKLLLLRRGLADDLLMGRVRVASERTRSRKEAAATQLGLEL